MMRLKNKVGVVTGSSRGIGRAIAERLAQEGALVAVHYGSNAEAAAETVRQIEAKGGAAFAVQADLARSEQIQQLFEALDAELTRRTGSPQFDILVNNAGVSSPASYREITVEQLDHVFGVNVRGAFFVTQAALSRLRDGGRVINISSTASRHASPTPMVAPYSMSKAALDAFTLALAQDLGPRQITANTIAPGAVETDMNSEHLQKPEVRDMIARSTALRRIGQVADIANAAALLASDDSAWITGQYIVADGGFRL
jgi:NAD(P)-dependent dehydrogenase (short-subunit alcohol dehydrogenase family)